MKYVFEEILCIETTILELLIVDNLTYGANFRIKMLEMLFESLRVVSVNFISSAVASLFLSGNTTGLSIEFGH